MGGPESGGPKGWGPKGWRPLGGPNPEKVGPEGWGARRVEGPKFRAFFALSHRKFHSLFSLWGFSRGILVVFEAPGRSNVRVWSSLVVMCEPRRPGLVGPPGFHTTARELQTRTFERPGASKHHQNSTRRHQREKKRTKFPAGESKNKSEILGGPGEGPSGGGGPGGEDQNTPTTYTHKQQPPTGTNRQQPGTTTTTTKNNNNQEQTTTKTMTTTTTTRNFGQNTKTPKLAKCGFGQMWFGQMRA